MAFCCQFCCVLVASQILARVCLLFLCHISVCRMRALITRTCGAALSVLLELNSLTFSPDRFVCVLPALLAHALAQARSFSGALFFCTVLHIAHCRPGMHASIQHRSRFRLHLNPRWLCFSCCALPLAGAPLHFQGGAHVRFSRKERPLHPVKVSPSCVLFSFFASVSYCRNFS